VVWRDPTQGGVYPPYPPGCIPRGTLPTHPGIPQGTLFTPRVYHRVHSSHPRVCNREGYPPPGYVTGRFTHHLGINTVHIHHPGINTVHIHHPGYERCTYHTRVMSGAPTTPGLWKGVHIPPGLWKVYIYHPGYERRRHIYRLFLLFPVLKGFLSLFCSFSPCFMLRNRLNPSQTGSNPLINRLKPLFSVNSQVCQECSRP